MKPADDPKVAVIKDGDRWTVIALDHEGNNLASPSTEALARLQERQLFRSLIAISFVFGGEWRGRVFVFEVQDRSDKTVGGKRSHHLEHYWLCGECSARFLVAYEAKDGIRLVPRQSASRFVVKETVERSRPAGLAS